MSALCSDAIVSCRSMEDALGLCLWQPLTWLSISGRTNICQLCEWVNEWTKKKVFLEQWDECAVLTYGEYICMPQFQHWSVYLLLLGVGNQTICTMWLLLSADTWWQGPKLQAESPLTQGQFHGLVSLRMVPLELRRVVAVLGICSLAK